MKSHTHKSRMLLAAYAVGFAILHLVANFSGWYVAHPWFDIPMHLGGGVWVAWAAFAYRNHISGYAALSAGIQALGVICSVALVGVLWELLEAAADAYGFYSQGIPLGGIADLLGTTRVGAHWDTLFDLINDLIGGSLVALIWLLGRKRK